MRGANKHNAQVHAEVVHLEDAAFGERQYNDAAELGERDAGQHRRAHLRKGRFGALDT